MKKAYRDDSVSLKLCTFEIIEIIDIRENASGYQKSYRDDSITMKLCKLRFLNLPISGRMYRGNINTTYQDDSVTMILCIFKIIGIFDIRKNVWRQNQDNISRRFNNLQIMHFQGY